MHHTAFSRGQKEGFCAFLWLYLKTTTNISSNLPAGLQSPAENTMIVVIHETDSSHFSSVIVLSRGCQLSPPQPRESLNNWTRDLLDPTLRLSSMEWLSNKKFLIEENLHQFSINNECLLNFIQIINLSSMVRVTDGNIWFWYLFLFYMERLCTDVQCCTTNTMFEI